MIKPTIINIFEHVYMKPEVNSNRFEISNHFEMSFSLHGNLHGDFTAATFKVCKMAKFSSEHIKKILAIHEKTLMKFFTSSMERLKNKIERFSNENTLLKQEVESLKLSADFQNK